MHWMKRQFGIAWHTGQPLREDIARKAASALKRWQRTRMRKWRAAWCQRVAERICEIGLPYRYDKDGCSIPAEADYQFEDLGVTFSDGGSAS